MSDTSNSVHLLVLIHGMWGNPSHLAELLRIMTETRCQADSHKGPGGESLHILVAETNRDDGTYDGIDWGGERVTEEVRQGTHGSSRFAPNNRVPVAYMRRSLKKSRRWRRTASG